MKFNDLIEELELLANQGFYTRGKISWWLLKYEKRYTGLRKIKDTLNAEFPNVNLRTRKSLIKELLFIELYEEIEKIIDSDISKLNSERINLDKIIRKIKSSTNGLDRKDENFKWDASQKE